MNVSVFWGCIMGERDVKQATMFCSKQNVHVCFEYLFPSFFSFLFYLKFTRDFFCIDIYCKEGYLFFGQNIEFLSSNDNTIIHLF